MSEFTPKFFKFSNKEIIELFKEALAAMEVKSYTFFKIRAYQNAIASFENLTSSIYDLWENNNLGAIPGVGGGIAQHLDELFTTGVVYEFENAKEGLPDGMFGLIGYRGLGPKRAFKLASIFELTNRETAAEKLKEHAKNGDIQKIPGFGEKSEKEMLMALESTKMTKKEKERMLLIHAEEIVLRILDYLHSLKAIKKIQPVGSFRRRKDTVGDLEFAVVTDNPEEVMEHFVSFPEVEDVLMKGAKRSSVVLKNDVQVDFRVSTPQAFGSMVQYFSGNKQHNILLRTYALEKRMSLSEYGIKKGDTLLEFSDEEAFYNALDLQYIPPEIRHGWNEIDVAKKHELPDLIKLSDIKGDLHMHTTDSDGINSLEDMVKAAQVLNYEYIGIADHAPSVQSHDEEEVLKIILEKRKKIQKINVEQQKLKVLFGYEVNILADATMSLPNNILKELDYVIGGIHTSFNQNKETLTKRFVSALENEYVDIIAHPMGRLINEREANDLDWERIFDAAKFNDKILEINSQPNRLDLSYELVKRAVDKGIRLIIDTDAHDTMSLLFMKYGIDVARRGWCSKSNILNTLEYSSFVKSFRLK